MHSIFYTYQVLLMTLQNAPPGLDYERDKKFSKVTEYHWLFTDNVIGTLLILLFAVCSLLSKWLLVAWWKILQNDLQRKNCWSIRSLSKQGPMIIQLEHCWRVCQHLEIAWRHWRWFIGPQSEFPHFRTTCYFIQMIISHQHFYANKSLS